MSKQLVTIDATGFKAGDVFYADEEPGFFVVEREVPDPPRPMFQFGTAIVDGERRRGFWVRAVDDAATGMFINPERDGGYMQTSGDYFADFVPDEDRIAELEAALEAVEAYAGRWIKYTDGLRDDGILTEFDEGMASALESVRYAIDRGEGASMSAPEPRPAFVLPEREAVDVAVTDGDTFQVEA